jgi:hypothetical protein
VCVVDKGGVNKVDRLISRIYALMNDSLVAKDVHTLQLTS